MNLNPMTASKYITAAILIIFLSAGNAAHSADTSIHLAQSKQPQEIDSSITEKLRIRSNPQTEKWQGRVLENDRNVIDKTLYKTAYNALIKCGYSTNESAQVAKEYVEKSKDWDLIIEKIKFTGAAPLHIQPDLAFWETVRAQCRPEDKQMMVFDNAESRIRQRSQKNDKLLVDNILATAAFQSGRVDLARNLFDKTIKTLGGVSAGDESARKARSVFYGESRKNFRGEPFERVMAYFYRGVIYWMDGELDNARACFRSGLIEDGDSEKSEYKSDYVLLEMLDGVLTTKLGGDGQYSLNRAKEMALKNSNARVPNVISNSSIGNLQVFIEFGRGPIKQSAGEFSEMLKIKGQENGVKSAVISIDGKKVEINPHDDLVFQATTRGGREMDYIINNKVVFKNTSANVGTGLITAASIAASAQDGAPVAGALLILGGAAYGLAYLANPACDIRTWWNLPQYLSYESFKLDPGDHTIQVDFFDSKNKKLEFLSQTRKVKVNDGELDCVVYFSDKKPCMEIEPK